MTAMVLERDVLPESLSSYFAASRITVTPRDGGVFLTPATAAEMDDNGEYISPDDYLDTMAYLNAVPDTAERLLAYRDVPDSAFKPAPRKCFKYKNPNR